MKKFFALVLALVMALSLTTVAWGAATTYEVSTKAQLVDALDNAADGDTIKLTADIDLGTDYAKFAKKLTLDLGTFTITSTAGSYGTVYVSIAGDLTINATTGGVVNTATDGIAVGNYGIVTINGGTFTGDYALYNFYYNATTFGTATINGGSLAFVANCGDLTVAGGSVESLDSSAVLDVTGGTIEELAVTEPDYAPPVTETTISNGTVESLTVEAAVEDSIEISGGTFSDDVSAYVADGSGLVKDTNGNWVAGVAVTFGDKFDLYQADAGMNAALKAKTPDVADLSFDEVDAKKNSDGSGRVAYIAANNGQFFVKTTNPTVADYAVTYAGKNTVLYYVTVAGTDAANFYYDEEVKAFNSWGLKCGQYNNTAFTAAQKAEDYFMASNKVIYLADDAGTGTNYLLNGVVVSGIALDMTKYVDHNFVANNFKYDATTGANVPTSALCTKCLNESTAIYKVGKAPAGSIVKPLNANGDTTTWVVVPGAAAAQAPVAGDKVESAQTFDAGIAMYVGMSVMAAAGSAVVLKKKD